MRAGNYFIAVLLALSHCPRGEVVAAEGGYPQVLQAHDYATIRFIEALHAALVKLGPESRPGVASTIFCEVNGDVVRFHSRTEPKRQLLLRQIETGGVAIGSQSFRQPQVTLLYSTLLKLLNDLAEGHEGEGVRFVQFQTRAYKARTILGFDFGAQVIEIDCFSNGPANEERLYVLDQVPRGKSYFWSHLK